MLSIAIIPYNSPLSFRPAGRDVTNRINNVQRGELCILEEGRRGFLPLFFLVIFSNAFLYYPNHWQFLRRPPRCAQFLLVRQGKP